MPSLCSICGSATHPACEGSRWGASWTLSLKSLVLALRVALSVPSVPAWTHWPPPSWSEEGQMHSDGHRLEPGAQH